MLSSRSRTASWATGVTPREVKDRTGAGLMIAKDVQRNRAVRIKSLPYYSN